MIINENSLKALKSILGDDIMDTLEKTEIYKPSTRTTLSPDEIKIGLQIVPKAILNWLMAHLPQMGDMGNDSLEIPFGSKGRIVFQKNGADNYSGEILSDNKRICEFKNRSIPGIGLLVLTSFELYGLEDMKDLSEMSTIPDTPEVKDKKEKLEDIIEQKLMLHRLVEDVVDQKIAQKDAIERLIKEKLNAHIMLNNVLDVEPTEGLEMSDNKKSKLKQFIERQESKRQEEVVMDKSEIKCSDCQSTMYKSENKNEIKLCICYGDSMNKSIKFKKTSEGRVKFKFPKNFDIESIEMLLEDIKKR